MPGYTISMKPELLATDRLLDIVHNLRTKCPWDRKQTHKSLTRYLLEEAHEAVEAIEEGNFKSIKEELGDVLLQVVLHSEIASETEKFDFKSVCETISEKMIRRHPHVFGGEDIPKNNSKKWSELKAKEKPNRTLLEGTPKSLPALVLAQRYGEIAASVGFDWEKASDVLAKVKEEIKELEVEIKKKNRAKMEMELGDLFFALTSLARHLKIDSEASLKKSAKKFKGRIEKVESQFKKKKISLKDCSPKELDAAWRRVKGHSAPSNQ